MATVYETCNANGVGTLGSHVAILRGKYDGDAYVRLPWGFEPVAAFASSVDATTGAVSGGIAVTVTKQLSGTNIGKYLIHFADGAVDAGDMATVLIYGAPNATF